MIEKITNIVVNTIFLAILSFAGYSIFTKFSLGWKAYLWEIVTIILIINSYFQFRLLLVSNKKIKRYEKRFFNIDEA